MNNYYSKILKSFCIYSFYNFFTHTHTHTHTHIQGVRHRPLHFSRVQVENIKLSRKVLYYFAIDLIVNEILIFENR